MRGRVKSKRGREKEKEGELQQTDDPIYQYEGGGRAEREKIKINK